MRKALIALTFLVTISFFVKHRAMAGQCGPVGACPDTMEKYYQLFPPGSGMAQYGNPPIEEEANAYAAAHPGDFVWRTPLAIEIFGPTRPVYGSNGQFCGIAKRDGTLVPVPGMQLPGC